MLVGVPIQIDAGTDTAPGLFTEFVSVKENDPGVS
jgi:hypothetical protein